MSHTALELVVIFDWYYIWAAAAALTGTCTNYLRYNV